MYDLSGVILDVDGTLVDSNDAHAHAWVQALAEHGFDVTFAQVRCLIGMGGDKLIPEVANVAAESAVGKSISQRRGIIFQQDYLPSIQPFPQVRELLQRLTDDGLQLVVASSAKKNELTALLEICGADEFITDKTSADDAERSKPDPDIVHAALKGLSEPSHAIMLGDTPYDVAAATAAGIGIVALRCGGWTSSALAGAVAVYDSPADLLAHYDASPFARQHVRA